MASRHGADVSCVCGQSSSKKVITKEEWEKKLSEVKIRKEDMNKLVMNFLVTEGYVEAAEKFQMESGTQPDIDLGTITDRMAVRKAVQCGQVEDAIEKVNDLNPEILDTNPQLFFHLQQQRLIELIRSGQVEEALEFAQEELAPRGEENVYLDRESGRFSVSGLRKERLLWKGLLHRLFWPARPIICACVWS
jgi:hypothetical protein